MEKDSFIFCQSDLTSSSFVTFGVMKLSGELVDFQITLQNRTFFAHRLVLAAGIPYFRAFFANSAAEIPLDGIDPDIFEDIVNFAYSGKIKITMANVQSLLTASHVLLMTQVNEACVKFMSMQVNINNVFQLRAFAGNIQSLRLTAACDRCILRNFGEFTKHRFTEFLQLPFPYLKEILSRDDLNVAKEEEVFEAVIKWVAASPEQRIDHLLELLCAVRMTRFTSQYLAERVSTEKLIISSSPCMQLVEQTKNYLSLPKIAPPSLKSANICTRNSTGHGLYAFCSSTIGNFIELYDVVKCVWITVAEIGGRETENVIGFNGKIYFVSKNAKEIATFDAKTLKIETLRTFQDDSRPTEDIQRVVLHDNKFYVFTVTKVYCFYPWQRKWLGLKAVIECEESGIASLGHYVYITGGWIRDSTTSVCKRYNPDTEKRAEISPMLQKRWSHGCVALNNRIYVCGGNSSEKSEFYDPFTDEWSYISPLRSPAFEISLVSYKAKLYAVSSDVMQVYDPEKREWVVGVNLPSCCKHVKYVAIPFSGEERGCPEFSDLQVQLQMGFSLGLNVSATYRKSS